MLVQVRLLSHQNRKQLYSCVCWHGRMYVCVQMAAGMDYMGGYRLNEFVNKNKTIGGVCVFCQSLNY